MSSSTRFIRWAAVLACTATVGLAAASARPSDADPETSDKDIIQTATGPNMEQVTTLVTAVKAAGLVETLQGPGPFTVFAPTNAAFAALPPGTVETLLKPENKDKLKAILLYHVHAGAAVMAKDAKTMKLSTADGDKMLSVKVSDGTVMVNDAKVIKADIVCKNGVIHWIDKVVLPPADRAPMGTTPGM